MKKYLSNLWKKANPFGNINKYNMLRLFTEHQPEKSDAKEVQTNERKII